ncbi:SMI1/KNR4 family protein [Streptomyces sp. NPDC051742]|uniref:SMI1/KNR4 family protein n=1 Tax=unclassified Streptomyces TaxID=2593676 RepID=UPI00341F56B0
MDALMRLMPPHEGAGEAVDWPRVEQAWGVRFPVDYKEFTATYGAGSIDSHLSLMVPEISGEGRPHGEMEEETLLARDEWEDDSVSKPEQVNAGSEFLLTWGVSAGADLLCWLTQDENPDLWPVVVRIHGKDEWVLYSCGMVEFLRRLILEEFEEYPISLEPYAGHASPRFLTHAEQRRIRESGGNPWAGITP